MARKKPLKPKPAAPLANVTPSDAVCNQAYQFMEGVVLSSIDHSLVDPLGGQDAVKALQKIIVDKDNVLMMRVMTKVCASILRATQEPEADVVTGAFNENEEGDES